MLDSYLFSMLVGTALGFLTGLGIGGGSLLMLWLTIIIGMDQAMARIINQMFFIPAAVISMIFRHRQGKLKLKNIYPAMIAGCAAAGLFTLFFATAKSDALQKAFGVILIIAGLRELFYRPRKFK